MSSKTPLIIIPGFLLLLAAVLPTIEAGTQTPPNFGACPNGFEELFFTGFNSGSTRSPYGVSFPRRSSSTTVGAVKNYAGGTFWGHIALRDNDLAIAFDNIPSNVTGIHWRLMTWFDETWDGHLSVQYPEYLQWSVGPEGSAPAVLVTAVATSGLNMCFPSPLTANWTACESGEVNDSDNDIPDAWYSDAYREDSCAAQLEGEVVFDGNPLEFRINCTNCQGDGNVPSGLDEPAAFDQVQLCAKWRIPDDEEDDTTGDEMQTTDEMDTTDDDGNDSYGGLIGAIAGSVALVALLGFAVVQRNSSSGSASVASYNAVRKGSSSPQKRKGSPAKKHSNSPIKGRRGGKKSNAQPAPPSEAPPAMPKGPRPKTADLGLPSDLMAKPAQGQQARRGRSKSRPQV